MVIIVSRWSNVIKLVSIGEGTDEDGFPAKVEVTGDDIFASELPVKSSEFYQASQAGYLIAKTFKLRSADYQGEKSLVFEEESYRIVRTYGKGEFIELSCEKRDVDHG